MSTARRPGLLKSNIRSYARSAYAEAILEAAERLFLRDGYHATRMADLAREAGVSVGTLYKHFPSKEAVFESLADRGRDEALVILRRALELPDPRQRVQVMVEELLGHVERQNAVLAVLAELGAPGEPHFTSTMAARDAEVEKEFVALLEAAFADGVRAGLIRADIEPSLLASMFSGALRGVLFGWLRAERREPLAPQAKPFLQLFFEGACAR